MVVLLLPKPKQQHRPPAMIRAQLDKMVECLESDVVKPDAGTYAQLLQAATRLRALDQGHRLHAHIISTKSPAASSLVILNHLINMYGKCGRLEDALSIFISVRHLRNLVSWNSIIAAFAQQGDTEGALQVFHEMHLEGIVADKVTYTTILNACFHPSALRHATTIHASIASRALDDDLILCTALVNAYCKCGSLSDAKRTFDAMHHRNVVTWTALIAGHAQHGHLEEALHLFWSMEFEEQDSVTPNELTFITVINLCAESGALEQGRAIHAYYNDKAKQPDLTQTQTQTQVVAALVNMYGRCGCVDDAFALFNSVPRPACTVPLWNAIISAYARNGEGEAALDMFHKMIEGEGEGEGEAQPGLATFCAALAACSHVEQGRFVHQCVRRYGFEWNVQIGTSLISMYGKCGSLEEARRMFDTMPHKNQVSWNAMLSTYSQHGQPSMVLQLYRCMLLEGEHPNPITLLSVVNSCCCLKQLTQLHHLCVMEGATDAMVSNALVYMYGRLGSIEDAWAMFNSCSHHNAVTWNGVITAYARCPGSELAMAGFQVLRRMHAEGVPPDKVTFVSLCGMMCNAAAAGGSDVVVQAVEEMVCQIEGAGYLDDPVIGTSLISLFGKCGRLEAAEAMFQRMLVVRSDIVPWNAMIGVYAQNLQPGEAVKLFRRMQLDGVKPDVSSIVCVLGSCCSNYHAGQRIELSLGYSGLESEVAVRNACINMHGKCGQAGRAASIFQAMKQHERDVISWNVMIAAYAAAGMGREAVLAWREMQQGGFKADKVTYVNLLNACDSSDMLHHGRQIHCHIRCAGLERQVVVSSALANMYTKCLSLEDAVAVFDELPMDQRNLVSWNGMIGAYAQHAAPTQALHLFSCMQLQGVKPDTVTFINLLDACATLTDLQTGSCIHAWVNLHKAAHEADDICITTSLHNAVMNMYAKCGNVDKARRVFDAMLHKSVVSWSGMLAAYAGLGHVDQAFKIFYGMQREGVRPNHITFISLLCACSHAGMLQRGCNCYSSMLQDHHMSPTQEHYGCMIDMLGRAGWLKEAKELIGRSRRSQEKAECNADEQDYDIKAWMTLLGACSYVGDAERGNEAAQQVLHKDPHHAAAYIALCNAHTSASS